MHTGKEAVNFLAFVLLCIQVANRPDDKLCTVHKAV
jgi:hypothetical protein